MTRLRRYLLTGLSLSLLATGSVSAHAEAVVTSVVKTDSVSNVVLLAQNTVTPRQAKAIALSRVKGGELVDISREKDIYRVRVIAKDGRVVDVYIDANTGRVRK